jgi:glycosyltransferase involved in cell wall biosynthesis
MYKKHKISVIMPCRNEGGHLAVVIKRIPKWVDEIVVVSNKSTDNTVEEARRLGLTVYEDNRTVGGIGYGYAHITGIKKAKGDIIVGIDGDATYPIENLKAVIDHLDAEGLDFISCNRYPLQGGTKIPLKLQLGVIALNLETRLLYGVKIKDVLSGMWVFRKSVRSKLKLTMGDWNLSPEIKVNAATNPAIKFGEYSIIQHRREGETKQHYLATGFSHCMWLFRNRLRLAWSDAGFFRGHHYAVRFAVVGAIAFVFNYILLLLLHRFTGMNKIESEAVAMLFSVHLTFLLHDQWTYKGLRGNREYFWDIRKRYASYVLSNGFSAILTIVMFGVFAEFMPTLLALGIAAFVSMIWNFVVNKVVIWRKPNEQAAVAEYKEEAAN